MDDCIFCSIIKGNLPASMIYEDKDLLAFMDIQPVNKGHILIISRQHKELITELDDSILSRMFVLAKNIDKAIRESGIKAEGMNLFLADGKAAGQEVLHVHLHIIPRFNNDGFGFIFPEGYEKRPQRNELDIISQLIKSHLV
mgnify:CR=1 FL=1